MSTDTLAQFNIPTGPDDTEGFKVNALVMPGQDDTLHGFVGLDSTISAESIPMLITALHACLLSLEDNCHNHPTQPLKRLLTCDCCTKDFEAVNKKQADDHTIKPVFCSASCSKEYSES